MERERKLLLRLCRGNGKEPGNYYFSEVGGYGLGAEG